MRKKILTIILIATMCLNMVACSNSNSNTDEGKSSIETIKKNEDQEKKGIEVDKKMLNELKTDVDNSIEETLEDKENYPS